MNEKVSVNHRHSIRNAEEQGVMAQEYCRLPHLGKPQYNEFCGASGVDWARCSMLNGTFKIYFT